MQEEVGNLHDCIRRVKSRLTEIDLSELSDEDLSHLSASLDGIIVDVELLESSVNAKAAAVQVTDQTNLFQDRNLRFD